MAFLDRFRSKTDVNIETKTAPVPLSSPSILEIFGVVGTQAGPAVTPASAMRVPAVAAAVQLIAGTVGTMPAKIFMRDGDGTKSPDPTHPAHSLVHMDANPWTSAHALRTQLTTDALLHGAGVAAAVRLSSGRVAELHRLDPAATSIDVTTGEPRFKVQLANGGHRFYPFTDVIYVPAPSSLDGITGTAPIQFAREAIALAITMESHAAKLFANGARPSGILKASKSLTAEAARRISEAWALAHGGGNTGRTAVLEEGMSFEQAMLSSVDAQFLELRLFQVVEIARAFRVPPSMVFENGRATWGNSEQERDAFLQFTLLPWIRTWEAAYRRVLLSPEERSAWTIEFVVDDLLRADTATRATAYGQFRSMGAMTANEVRARENLPALPGGDELQNPFTTSATPTKPEASE